MTGEQVVLLDEDGRATGTAAKRAVHHRATPLHLAFSCYVFDSAGAVLLTRRAPTKPTWPGVWTNSFCGHPAPGEPWSEALTRRAEHELGLRITGLSVALPAFRYRAVMDNGVVENEICPVFTAFTDDRVAADPTEVAEHRWMAWTAFRAQVTRGRLAVSPWCLEQVALLPAGPPRRADAGLDTSRLPSTSPG